MCFSTIWIDIGKHTFIRHEITQYLCTYMLFPLAVARADHEHQFTGRVGERAHRLAQSLPHTHIAHVILH